MQVLEKQGKSWGMAGRGRGAGGAGGRGPGAPSFAKDLSDYTCPRCGLTGEHFEKDCPAPDRLVKRVRYLTASNLLIQGSLCPTHCS